MAFAVIFPWLKMRDLFEIFEDAYEDPGNCAAPRRILTFGVGFNLFTEFDEVSDKNLMRRCVLGSQPACNI
jgi:hypothetical protein